jgi:AraC-like DNA-binding protein
MVQTENTPKSKVENVFDAEETSLSLVSSQSDLPVEVAFEARRSFINFYFCNEGTAEFVFGPGYARAIGRQRNFLIYNPEHSLPFTIRLAPGTTMVVLSISLEGLHKLFVQDTLPFLKQENVSRKFYDERDVPAQLFVVLNQLFNIQLSEASSKLYFQAKTLEILSLYFSTRKPNTESCPFLNDEEAVRKIKHAKEHLLRNMENPPTLKELARLAGLNEYQLKVGFKEIYGNTVYGYLLDHKLDHSRALLDKGKYQVNQVAYEIGYTNPSHFIAAFRKKFGVTPKKYLMNHVDSNRQTKAKRLVE